MSFVKNCKRYAGKRLTKSAVLALAAVMTSGSAIASSSAADLAPRPIELRGSGLALQQCRDPEVLLEGPAGTGKTIAALQKLYYIADTYPGARILIIRKVKASLAETVLATFEKYVLPPNHPEQGRVKREGRKVYNHINGSVIVCGGLDKPDKLLSSDWDIIYFAEALEAEEEGYETLIGRLRGDATPYQQIIADCNPGHPRHFLNLRAGKPGRPGSMTRLKSRHEDNPRWHDGKDWTEAGKSYIAKLKRMTGARRLRYLEGTWAASTGTIYGEAVQETHWVDNFDVPDHWRRFWVIDFGFTNPFVWWEVAEDEDGHLYKIQEMYHTGILVEDAADMIMKATAHSPTPVAIICDHDAEGRATFEKHTGYQTTPAVKDKLAGINAVKNRLKVRESGKPGLMFFNNCLIHDHDETLIERKKPLCTDDEFAGYEWNPKPTVKGADQPIDVDNHGMDVMRYLIAEVDGIDEFGAPEVLEVVTVSRTSNPMF